MNLSAPPSVRVLLLPGWLGSGPGHWQRRWEALHGDTLVEQDDWQTPRRGDWIARLEDEILADPRPVALVAHSLGCHLVAAWAASSRHAARAVAALLVAPPDLRHPGLPSVLSPWQRPLTPPGTAAPALPFGATVVFSTDDPYCSSSAAQRMARDWGASSHTLGARGHINADSGLGDWPEGRGLLRALLPSPRHNPQASPI